MRFLKNSVDQLFSAVQQLGGQISLAQPVPLSLPVPSHAPSTLVPNVVGHGVAAADVHVSASGHKRDPKVHSYLRPLGAVWDPDVDE